MTTTVEPSTFSHISREPGPDEAARVAWVQGYGVIEHSVETIGRVDRMIDILMEHGRLMSRAQGYALLRAADRTVSAAMWLVVHMTYARDVHLDGSDLEAKDFKEHPEGHTGGSLNMVPAYVGYMLANALCNFTRAWVMGQGHCVAAIDAVNYLLDNMTPVHRAAYSRDAEGLTNLVRDFYAYKTDANGKPHSPLGSHVNAHTAGGTMEGGYLGLADLQYVHMPLPGESLVAFLSDGAFEEQRGSDWAPRWWRNEDCGWVAPVLIMNGRRMDQRTTTAQVGGVDWMRQHLKLNSFDPIEIDGTDPAAFAWAIFTSEERLGQQAAEIANTRAAYPVKLPYTLAITSKGYGFPGAGSNRAHNLPLSGMPRTDARAREEFNDGVRNLWVSWPDVLAAGALLRRGVGTTRFSEASHPLSHRYPALPDLPALRDYTAAAYSPMEALDTYFCEIARTNKHLRVRVGNPDEMISNRMYETLGGLKHRVTNVEDEYTESLTGAVVTALNEEAVVSAALGNRGGLNLVVTYEAFATKMLGAVRQEVTFARNLAEAGTPAHWLGVPIVLTSHVWENGKNEHSHQDPTFAEAMWGESSDTSRVVFVPDACTAQATLREVFQSRGQIWTLVVPKGKLPVVFSAPEAQRVIEDGAILMQHHHGSYGQLVATGAYQLREALRAAKRMRQRGVPVDVVYLAEPARFRVPRDEREKQAMAPHSVRTSVFRDGALKRVYLTHTRPEPFAGLLRDLGAAAAGARVLGFQGHGGTLDTEGMLFANGCTWAHAVDAMANLIGMGPGYLLSDDEMAALEGLLGPEALNLAPDIKLSTTNAVGSQLTDGSHVS